MKPIDIKPNHNCKRLQIPKFKYTFIADISHHPLKYITRKNHIQKVTGTYLKSFLYHETGLIQVYERRGHSRKKYDAVINFEISKLNNINARQRRIFKKLIQQAKDFRIQTFSCDGCVFKPAHLLTNHCNKTYVEI